ncbi:MAG TPA: hypothetical protein VNG12_02115 [Acidimicrobiales bacterium]|nr:hypothetical protein [Acidimicrobiales bacterium]
MGAVILEEVSAVHTASGSTGPLEVGPLTTLAVDVNVSAVSGTTPSMSLVVERQGSDGNWYSIWAPSAVTVAGVVSTSIGPGCATAAVVTSVVRLRWSITGTTPSFTFSASVIAR